MAVLKMDLRQWEEWHLRIGDNFKPAAIRGCQSAAMRAIVELQQRTRTAPPANPAGIGHGGAVDTGSFLRSWRSIATEKGADLYNDSPHGPIVLGGRRPGGKRPPITRIVAWLQRRLGLSAAVARKRAFATAGAIRKRGLLGRPIMNDDFQKKLAEIAAEEIRHELEVELAKGPQ